jgi:hypothetical protein
MIKTLSKGYAYFPQETIDYYGKEFLRAVSGVYNILSCKEKESKMPFVDQKTNYDFGKCPFVFVKDNYIIIGGTAGSLVLNLKHPEYIFEDPFLLTNAQRSIDPSVVHIDLHAETEEAIATFLDISKYNEMQEIVNNLVIQEVT